MMTQNKPRHGKGWRVVVVGCGSIGRRHLMNLQALRAQEIYACDLRADRRLEVRAGLNVETVESLHDVWTLEPDAIVIATPTSLHMPLALEAAVRGVHLFIEKPLANSWVGVERLIELARQKELVSLVGCNMRFHPGLVMVKRLIMEQSVGRIIAARVEVGQYLPDWHPWEDYRKNYSARVDLGGGVILDAIHELDYIRWLVGEVTGVFCLADKLSHLEIDTEDSAALLLRFDNGAIGEVHLDYVQRAYSRTCHIICEEGTIHWDYTAGHVRCFSALANEWQCIDNPPCWKSNQMYLDEMRHFLNCLGGEATPQQDLFEASQVLKVALSAKKSARELCWIEPENQEWNSDGTL